MNYEKKYFNGFFINTLAFIGSFYSLNKSLKGAYSIKKYFFSIKKDLIREYGYGWTVITGGTDGLGKSYAKEMYKKGCNIILISRDTQKLIKTKEELTKNVLNNNNKIEYITFDFDEDYSQVKIDFLRQSLEIFDINILINNVGTATINHFEKLSNNDIKKTINLNIFSATFLTQIILEKMKKRENKSLVVFVGTDLVFYNPPYLQIYSATKSYLENLSKCLEKEFKNIEFTYIAPGPIETNLNPRKNFFKVKSDDFAKSSIEHFGTYSFSYGHYIHGIKNAIFRNKIINYLYTEKDMKEEFKPKI